MDYVRPTSPAQPTKILKTLRIEVHTAIICCTIPTLRPFVRQFLPDFLTSGIQSTNPRTGGIAAGPRPNYNGSIPLGSVASKKKPVQDDLDDYSSSTEQFATRNDIEGGFDNARNWEEEDKANREGIIKQTEVSVQYNDGGRRK